MRCSTVSGLLLVAAAAAGGLLLGVVCAAAGPNEPAIRAAPVRDAMATERAKGVNRFVMRCFLFQRSGYAAPGCRGRPLIEERPGHRTGSGKTPAEAAEDHPLVTVAGAVICARDQRLGVRPRNRFSGPPNLACPTPRESVRGRSAT